MVHIWVIALHIPGYIFVLALVAHMFWIMQIYWPTCLRIYTDLWNYETEHFLWWCPNLSWTDSLQYTITRKFYLFAMPSVSIRLRQSTYLAFMGWSFWRSYGVTIRTSCVFLSLQLERTISFFFPEFIMVQLKRSTVSRQNKTTFLSPSKPFLTFLYRSEIGGRHCRDFMSTYILWKSEINLITYPYLTSRKLMH